ncbi:MAG: hypothetical protein JNK29_13225, partial [Anaerolineales bacterium]|nr:hypothetical protein [Anaerolineales bacterium]
MSHITLAAKTLSVAGQPLLTEVPPAFSLEPDPAGVGAFLRASLSVHSDRHALRLGALTGLERFTACWRFEPFWMKPAAGMRGREVPAETQVLLIERADTCILLVPLVDGPARASLEGAPDDILKLNLETGDPATVVNAATVLFIAAGPDPYALAERAAISVLARLPTGRRRVEKTLPAFVDQFGWCTWDAFYQEVAPEKVRAGLESFAAGGVRPRLLILDDGWQSEQTQLTGERRLTAFGANAKFGGDLAPTVRMAKDEFGVTTFLVWHALAGYWGGVDGPSFPDYDVRSQARVFSPAIRQHMPAAEFWWGPLVGVVPPQHIHRFFHELHRRLREQGVDGVKVDNQAALEGVAAGLGGRVNLMRRYHEALEGSAHVHFGGNLINCMSCSNEMLYGALNSTLTRTSTDFWPQRPETHGVHLYANAQVGVWFGEFVHPDWDMFQSGHPAGAYHAAGRAVSGGPVYVSDKPEVHDFDLLRTLVLPDGTVPRAQLPGRPTRDCLFHDPTREAVLLKIFNRNAGTGVVGAFNARYAEAGTEPVAGQVCPADVPGLAGARFAVYAYTAREVRVLAA